MSSTPIRSTKTKNPRVDHLALSPYITPSKVKALEQQRGTSLVCIIPQNGSISPYPCTQVSSSAEKDILNQERDRVKRHIKQCFKKTTGIKKDMEDLQDRINERLEERKDCGDVKLTRASLAVEIARLKLELAKLGLELVLTEDKESTLQEKLQKYSTMIDRYNWNKLTSIYCFISTPGCNSRLKNMANVCLKCFIFATDTSCPLSTR